MTAPIPNSYRVSDRLLAGEYPGDRNPERARGKIGALLDAGMSVFVDLTTVHDRMVPYDDILAHEARRRGIEARRVVLPILDQGTIDDAGMNRILREIECAQADGHTVYVHCWGGVGRTGLVVGCHLANGGMVGDEALERVRELFASMSPAKLARHPGGSPETREQRAMVRRWRCAAPSRTSAPSLRERYVGALLGLAAGDALGTTLEFRRPGSFQPIHDMIGGGPFRLEPGQWTDDTSMAMCLAASLIETGRFDAEDQMRRYLRWLDEGYWSSTGRFFDVGNTVRASLERFRRTGEPFSGPADEHTAGNGSLMRLAPVVLRFAYDPELAIRMAGESSRTTHGAGAAIDACRYFAALLVGALRGVTKEELLAPAYSPAPGLWEREPLHPEVRAVADSVLRSRSGRPVRGKGYVVDCLDAALWAFATTSDFRDGALAAVNLGDDADTTGAVYGQIAGAWYGSDSIPSEWRARLTRAAEIQTMAERLLTAAGEGA